MDSYERTCRIGANPSIENKGHVSSDVERCSHRLYFAHTS